jgi:hypothetical protein
MLKHTTTCACLEMEHWGSIYKIYLLQQEKFIKNIFFFKSFLVHILKHVSVRWINGIRDLAAIILVCLLVKRVIFDNSEQEVITRSAVL